MMCAGSRGAGDGRGEDGKAGLPGEGQQELQAHLRHRDPTL